MKHQALHLVDAQGEETSLSGFKDSLKARDQREAHTQAQCLTGCVTEEYKEALLSSHTARLTSVWRKHLCNVSQARTVGAKHFLQHVLQSLIK